MLLLCPHPVNSSSGTLGCSVQSPDCPPGASPEHYTVDYQWWLWQSPQPPLPPCCNKRGGQDWQKEWYGAPSTIDPKCRASLCKNNRYLGIKISFYLNHSRLCTCVKNQSRSITYLHHTTCIYGASTRTSSLSWEMDQWELAHLCPCCSWYAPPLFSSTSAKLWNWTVTEDWTCIVSVW